MVLENVRFNKGEKKDDETLSKKYAALCDVYVMDAFGTAHRAQASTHGVGRVCACRLCRPAAVRRAGSAGQGHGQPGPSDGRHRGRF